MLASVAVCEIVFLPMMDTSDFSFAASMTCDKGQCYIIAKQKSLQD